MQMESTLTQRTNTPDGYYNAEVRGKTYSVVDFGTTNKTHPFPDGLFMGWEAIEIVDNEMKSDTLYRASSWEELEKQL